jgi:hypothetical protein
VPAGRARAGFLRRYTLDTLARIEAFARVATRRREARVLHGDARELDSPAVRRVLTSPPYPGLIDYHEQHRYAYELLGLDDRASARSAPPLGHAPRRIEATRGIAASSQRPRALRPARRARRRQRPPRPLPGDPRTRRAPTRAAPPLGTREPADRAGGRASSSRTSCRARVLSVRKVSLLSSVW